MVLDQGFEFFELAKNFIFVLHEVNPCLPRKVINERNIVYIYPLRELDDIGPHTSEWIISKIPFSLLSHLEMSSLYSFLSHILCRPLHILLEFLEDLQQLCLQVVVLCNAHVQAFYAK